MYRTHNEAGTGIEHQYDYTYDSANNRITMVVASDEDDSVAYTYDKNNRLLTETRTENGVDVTTTYTYDPNGNTLTIISPNSSGTYTYNSRNQQISYTDGTNTVTYAYQPDGLRLSKTIGAIVHKFVWSMSNMVYEYLSTAPTDGTVYV